MSGESEIVVKGADIINDSAVVLIMPDNRRDHVEVDKGNLLTDSPCDLIPPESGVKEDSCVESITVADTSDKKAGIDICDGGDNEKIVVNDPSEPDAEVCNQITDKEMCNSHSKSPRVSTPESDVEQENCVKTVSDNDTSEKELVIHISDGGDNEKSAADDFTVPDDDLCKKIIKQVEFYFSDVNISKDSYLLKQVRRNKHGYVSLWIVSTFKKVKSLTKDRRVVVFSLRQSEELEVNKEGTKVRRRKPLPEYDETTPFRTVVAVNLGHKHPTVQWVTEEFSACKGLKMVRIVRPCQNIPQDLSKYSNNHPELGTTMCAVIEFETPQQAKRACKTMTDTEDWRNGRRVTLLTSERLVWTKKEHGEKVDGGDGEGSRKNGAHKHQGHGGIISTEKNSSSSNSGSDGESPLGSQSCARKGSGDSKSSGSPESMPRSGSLGSSTYNHRHQNKGKYSPADATYHQAGPPNPKKSKKKKKKESSQIESSPWVQRRQRNAKDSSSPMNGTGNGSGDAPQVRSIGSKLPKMVDILRPPKGPDGTRGFSGGLGRGKPRCNTIM